MISSRRLARTSDLTLTAWAVTVCALANVVVAVLWTLAATDGPNDSDVAATFASAVFVGALVQACTAAVLVPLLRRRERRHRIVPAGLWRSDS